MTLEEYWAEIVADISNIESHGDAIAAISNRISAEDVDVEALTAERDALITERDDLRTRYDAAVSEIRSRWSDLSHGGSVTKVTEFTAKPETVETATNINDLDMSQMILSGKGE